MSLLDDRETTGPAGAVAADGGGAGGDRGGLADRSGTGSSRPVSDARSLLRQARLPLVVAGILVVAGLISAAVQSSGSGADLDPTSYTPGGARALATLLAERGSPVTRVGTVPTGGSGATTLVVPESQLLNGASLHRLLDAARTTDVVLFVGDEASAETLGVVVDDPDFGDDDADPRCSLPAATTASDAHFGTAGFVGRPAPLGFTVAASCYPGMDDEPKLVSLHPVSGSGTLTLVAGTAFLTNSELDSEGDAALALGLIGHRRPVAWIQPATAQGGDGDGGTPVFTLLPHRLKVAVWELVVTLLLLVLWRSRRLGPIVVERLPVAVRAVETVRGRARLYRGGQARDRAALALQEAARARLAKRLGLGEATVPPALVRAVAARAGRREDAVAVLLYGSGAPGDDAALVGFAADLDRLVADSLAPGTTTREAGQQ